MRGACWATTTRAQYHHGEQGFRPAGHAALAIEYLLYHEMLHLKHPVRVRAGRRCVHSGSSRPRSGCSLNWSRRRRT